jgi:predicted dinucleotide-binding enzyme
VNFCGEGARSDEANVASVEGARLIPMSEAIDQSEIIILAVPYTAALSIVATRHDWCDKILVDATNPLGLGQKGLSIGTTTSGAEEIAARAANARVVKAFNSTGVENIIDPHYQYGDAIMPVAGDDDEARRKVIAIARRIGFDAIDCGQLAAARYLEPFAMMWLNMAANLGRGRNFAFGLLTRRD